MALVRDHMALIFLRTLILSGGVALSACGGGGGTAGAALTVEVLSSGTYYGRFHFERLRLTRDGSSPTYAIWFPPPGVQAGAKAPAVLLSDPYGGIDWTGEALDTQAREEAATDGFVMLPDVHGPPHPAGIPLYVPYDYAALADAGGGALAYLLNGIGVLMLYQRTYAGGDLQDDIDDTLSGLLYLRQNPQVDRRLIGAWGSSYGGSLLLYAMAQAADAQRPGFAAILTPIVDFEQFVTYADWLAAVHQDAGQAVLRLQPFAVRVRAAAARSDNPTGLARYGIAPLLANRQTKILFLHDLLDTIAPLFAANALYFGTPGLHQVFIYPHQGVTLDWASFPVAHDPVKPGYDESSAVLFSQAYLLLRLQASAAVVRLPRLGDVEAVFGYLRQQQLLGADLDTFLRPRLQALCDARLRIVRYDDLDSGESGCEFVARMLRTHWGYEVRADEVIAFLGEHGL